MLTITKGAFEWLVSTWILSTERLVLCVTVPVNTIVILSTHLFRVKKKACVDSLWGAFSNLYIQPAIKYYVFWNNSPDTSFPLCPHCQALGLVASFNSNMDESISSWVVLSFFLYISFRTTSILGLCRGSAETRSLRFSVIMVGVWLTLFPPYLLTRLSGSRHSWPRNKSEIALTAMDLSEIWW